MPVLAANQVTLAEVLEVKGVPLSEEEIWAVLCQAGKELELLLANGKGKQYGQPALLISPDTLILSHSGQVKVSAVSSRDKSKNPTYRAPELSSRTVPPSDGAVEKMYVYSLGMTVYFAAEYQLTKSKMTHLSVSLGNLLLSMCEELAGSRYSLRQVLEACGSKYGKTSYSKIIKGLVVLVLGNNIPEVSENDDNLQPHPPWKGNSPDYQHPSRAIRSRYGQSLNLPSPPLIQRVSHGQATAAELVGSNDRTAASPDEQSGLSQNKFMTKIPHTLDKYRKYLGKARQNKSESVTSPVVADRSIELRDQYGSMPAVNGRHSLGSEVPLGNRYGRTHSHHEEDKGYEEGPADGMLSRSRSEKLWSSQSGSLGSINYDPGSDASSEASSLSDHRKSTLSSAQSSSVMSLMEGSYAPRSSLTDYGSDLWGSVGSLRDSNELHRLGEWHHSSVGDLRSVSDLSHTDNSGKKVTGLRGMRPITDGQRKYHSEQNLVSPEGPDNGKRRKKVPKAKLRKFFGPEFVQVTEDPDRSLVNITPEKNKKRASGRRLITVVMLNEQRLEMDVESSTKVQELFTQITKYIGISEKIYFGLARLEDDEHFFLDFDHKLSKYAPPGWKEQSKKFTGNYTLYFRVKFYVENLSLLRHQETMHQLYLQLRNDILHDKLYADQEPGLSLASFAIQAEYGDYNQKRFGKKYFKPRHYLPHRILVRMTEDYVCQKLRSLHKVQSGLNQEDAELKFIKEAQKLSEYGMHFHNAQLNKKENQFVYLGICVPGVTIFELRSNKKSPLVNHSWQMIKKLAFKKKKFYIEPRVDGNTEKEAKMTFLSSSYKRSKYLLYLCTSFHRFQMRMKVRLLSMDEEAPKGKKKRTSLGPFFQSGSIRHLNGDDHDSQHGRLSVNGAVKGSGLDSSDEEERLDSRRTSQISHEKVNGFVDSYHEPGAINHNKSSRNSPYILDSTPSSAAAYSERTPSPQQDRERRPADVILSPDRKVKAIKLKKDSRGALGLTVVGGEDTRRLHFGIFIKRIAPGSVSDNDGRLQVGDRILAVNGKSLEYVSHDEAVQTLKNAGTDVELLVSQSTRTDSNIDMSVLESPAVKSLSRQERPSPYLVQTDNTPLSAKPSRLHDNNHPPKPNAGQELESPKPPSYKSIHKPRSTSVSSSDVPLTGPSSPEPSSRGKHRGGIKLPGMDDERMLQDIKLSRNGTFTSARTSQFSEESPGSIASFGEKVHRQHSLPQPVPAHESGHECPSASVVSAPYSGSLGRSRTNSDVSRQEDVGTAEIPGKRRSSQRSDVGSRSRTPSVNGVQLEQRDSVTSLGQLPVGIVWDSMERRKSENEDVLCKHFTVELDKVSGSLGLNVAGGINTSVKDGAIFVKSLYPNGPADLDGRIQVGHRIISVNGISLQGVTHKQAVETIKRAPVRTVLVIEGPPLEEGSSGAQRDDGNDRKNEKERVFEVVLMKGIGGLGMSLVGGTDCDEEYGGFGCYDANKEADTFMYSDSAINPNMIPRIHCTAHDQMNSLTKFGESLRIKAMFPGQPAENSEQLRVGDIILSANGVSLEGKTNRDAINVLRDQPARVVLLVKRDSLSFPPGLLRRGSFSQNIDPNEILSVIHSTLRKEDSRRSERSMYSGEPEYESSSETQSHGRRELSETEVRRKSDGSLCKGSFNVSENSEDSIGDLGKLEDEQELPLPDEELLNEAVSGLPSSEGHSSALPPPPDQSDYVNGNDEIASGEVMEKPKLSPSGFVDDGSISTVDDGDKTLVDVDKTMTEDGGSILVGDGSETMLRDGAESRMASSNTTPAWTKPSIVPLDDRYKEEKLAPDEEMIDVVLHKGSSGLGFTLAGGADTVGGCFVREIIGDPARSEGTLRPKDQIVMVNGQDTTNKKHMDAVNILRSTRNEVHLVIRRRPDKVKSKTRDGLDIKTVSIIRATRGRIGLTLAEDKEGRICAKDVVPDEPAAKDGGLKRGDIIMEINGERVDGAGLQFAETCLDNARPVVTLVLKQFRTEAESKYVLSSPTESDQDLFVESLTKSIYADEEVPKKHVEPQLLKNVPSEQALPELYPQKQETVEQSLSERRTSVQSSKASPCEPQSLERKSPTSLRNLPPAVQPRTNHRPPLRHQDSGSFMEKYSRYKITDDEVSEPSMELTSNSGLQFMSENNIQKKERSTITKNQDEEKAVMRETGNEDYRSDYYDDEDDDDGDVVLKEEEFVTTLVKGPRGLGFSLYSGRTMHDTPGLFIRSIQPNSVVAEDGKIKVGDQLLKVNDEDVEQLNHSQVITMLRSLSGEVKLEMLRVQDGDEEEDEPAFLTPGQPGVSEVNKPQGPSQTAGSSASTSDFKDDLSIVLNALNKNVEPAMDDENSLDRTSDHIEGMRNGTFQPKFLEKLAFSEAATDDDRRLENWPEPPPSLCLENNNLEPPSGGNLDYNDNLLATSEDDATSVTFSEDGFLEELEGLAYTPSPDSEGKRVGFGVDSSRNQGMFADRRSSITELENSRDFGIINGSKSVGSTIPIKQGSSLSNNLRTALNNMGNDKNGRTSSVSGEETFEMSALKRNNMKATGYLSTSREGTPRTKDSGVNEPGALLSPLIPESFLDASQPMSSSQATSPDAPPPLPTTPIPSDDDLRDTAASRFAPRVQSLPEMTMRRRFEKVVSEENMPKGRFDYSLRPKSPLVGRRPDFTKPTGPLLDIRKPSPLYSGESLQQVVKKLEDAISSGQASDEFQTLREMKPIDNCPSGKRALNKEKNRYRNVLPYEKTRVVLSGDEQMDYINANYINFTVASDVYHYIATQGPLPGTTTDFWKMIWEQKSQVIAMVTLDMESGKVKCHRYWPESPELPVKVHRSLEVHLKSVETCSNYVQRLITVKNIENNECLEVVHLNFVCWPDHGVPRSASELVDFIQHVRSCSNLGPYVVHCSAGIGRTGTLLTIDTCLKYIEKGYKFDIYSVVHSLREQRPGMIQTKDQYVFCYQACVEVLKSLQN